MFCLVRLRITISGLVTVLEVEKNKKNNQNEKKNNQKITLSKPKYC